MSHLHEGPQQSPCKPDAAARGVQDDSDAKVDAFGARCQLEVPLVSLINNPGKPVVNAPHHIRQAHSRPLGKMAELVRQHSCKLAHVQSSNKRQADRKHQIVAQ